MNILRANYSSLLPIVSAFVILISCIGAFYGLESSSLWTDELFSAYFADPKLPTFGAFLNRASEDVNSPGYYFVLWATLRSTSLDFVLGSRGLSAVFGCVAILALLLAPTRAVGLTPRLVAGAFAATSLIWFTYTQEARSYALCFLLVTVVMAAALRCVEHLRDGRIPDLPLVALVLLSLLASLSHYYAIFLAGGVFTVLLLFCRSLRGLAFVSIMGFLLLAFLVAFVLWHLPQVVVDIHKTWFSANYHALKTHTFAGLSGLISTGRSTLILLVIAALAIWAFLSNGRRETYKALAHDHLGAALALLIGSFLFAYFYAIAVTIIFTPMVSFRLFNVLAPVAWIGLAYVVQIVLNLMHGSIRAPAVKISLALALLVASSMVLQRGRDMKEAWQASAERVAELAGCTGAILPVVWWEQPYFRENNPERFYGFYLPPDPDRGWLPLTRFRLLTDLKRDEMRAIVLDTAEGRRKCTLLLWSVHMRLPNAKAVASALAAPLGENASGQITLEILRPKDGGVPGYLFLLQRKPGES